MAFISPDDEKYLLRRLGQNDVVLFVGAGFPREATNSLGSQMPLSAELCAELWAYLGYPDAWDGTLWVAKTSSEWREGVVWGTLGDLRVAR